VLEEFRPDEGAMEALYFSKNVTSALLVAEAKGVIRLACGDRGLALVEYRPDELKKSLVGSARADKADVQKFVALVLGLTEAPKPDHAADALAAAVCHCHARAVDPRLVRRL
jgi:crossover junction endodeoxyribonuclease RuvC